MKILGNRVLVSKVEEEKTEGFQTVDVQDSFVYKGKVQPGGFAGGYVAGGSINEGDTILFRKYSPDTETIQHGGQEMKIIRVDDVLAVL